MFFHFGNVLCSLLYVKCSILNCKRTTGAGLAGLRVGYGAFPLSIIEFLWRAKQPYNVSAAAEISACAALQNPTYLEVNSCPIGVVHIYTNHLI